MNQFALWENIEPINMSIEDVAIQLNVSLATVRNWVKVGNLQSVSTRFVTKESVELFIKQEVGKSKLTARANKLQKVSSAHSEIFDLNADCGTALSVEYEQSLSEAYRNQEGIYYTPTEIVDNMLQSIQNVENKTFLEPCCGGGNFVIGAIKKGIKPENIYAFDTDKNAVEITQKRIFEETGYVSSTIVCGNFLDLCGNLNQKFDYIFTNPPWGKKIAKSDKEQYAQKLKAGTSTDTSSLFLFACLKLLNKTGKLGFLLPEAFFNIATFEDARKQMLSKSIERLIDYGKPFKGLITKAQAVVLKNDEAELNNKIVCELENETFSRTQASFEAMPKHIFNFWINQETSDTITYLYSKKYITLKNNAQWALGVVTGNNDKLCHKQPTDGLVPIYRGKDISQNGFAKPELFINEKLRNCQQVAPIEMYKAKEKLVYRFISNKLVFFCDTEQNYILNSANLLILNELFPLTGKQLADLLNSNIMNWLFQTIFNTHKVLRGDLELLPIYYTYFIDNKHFDEIDFLNYLQIEKKDGTYRIKK